MSNDVKAPCVDKKRVDKKLPTVILIGMPGAGKSSVGRVLARTLNYSFIDTDDLIAEDVGSSLHEFVTRHGYVALRHIEERILLDTVFANAVVATGGSAVYSARAMNRLAGLGPCIYLQASLQTIEARVGNFSTRAIAEKKGTTMAQLFSEREPLYRASAQLIVDTDNGQSVADVVGGIVKVLSSY